MAPAKHEMAMFGDVRNDDYYWLRDDSRSNPEVTAYLNEENAYSGLVMKDSKSFEKELYKELRGRIKEDDISAPIRKRITLLLSENFGGQAVCSTL